MMNQNANLSEEQIETALSYTAKFTTPVMMMVWGFITYIVISAIIGLLAAIFIKKEDPSLNATM